MLKSVNLDGSTLTTAVPFPMADYLVSSNLDVCLFRGTNGNLYFYRSGMVEPKLVWQTKERFLMKQVAFSPSGDYVAFASDKQNGVDLVGIANTNRIHLPLAPKFGFDNPLVAWSPDENTFYVGGFENKLRLMIRVQADNTVVLEPIEGTNAPAILLCYGRIGTGGWWGGNDWGVSHSRERCGDLEAMAWPGLDSGLWINRESGDRSSRILGASVRPGLCIWRGFISVTSVLLETAANASLNRTVTFTFSTSRTNVSVLWLKVSDSSDRRRATRKHCEPLKPALNSMKSTFMG
jgi:hypothetical protein